MGRRHIGGARRRRERPAFGGNHARCVNRHRHRTITAMLNRVSCGRIAGIFAPDLIARLEDGAQHDPQSVLGSRCQHDLVRIAAQPARRQQMVGNGGAKFAAASGIAVMEMIGAEGAHAPSDKGPEALQGAIIDMRAAERQCALRRSLDDDPGFAGAACLRRDARCDERARADDGDRKPVGDQSFIRRRDGVAAKTGLARKCPRRRQRFTGLDDAADDGVAKRLVEPVWRGRARRHMRPGKIQRQLGPSRRR